MKNSIINITDFVNGLIIIIILIVFFWGGNILSGYKNISENNVSENEVKKEKNSFSITPIPIGNSIFFF